MQWLSFMVDEELDGSIENFVFNWSCQKGPVALIIDAAYDTHYSGPDLSVIQGSRLNGVSATLDFHINLPKWMWRITGRQWVRWSKTVRLQERAES